MTPTPDFSGQKVPDVRMKIEIKAAGHDLERGLT